MKLLAGDWERITSEAVGKTDEIPEAKRPRLFIRGDQFGFSGLDDRGDLINPESVVVARGEKAEGPPKIDLTPTSPAAGPLRNVTYPGIYKLEGHTLTLALDIRRNGVRPNRFSTQANDIFAVDVYVRSVHSQFSRAQLKKLAGKWEWVSTATKGTKTPVEAGKAILVIKDDRLSFDGLDDKGDLRSPEKFQLSAASKPETDPSLIDLTPMAEHAGPMKGVTYKGIYKLDGDTLVFALDIQRVSDRPTGFSTTSETTHVVDVFRRVKKVAKP